MGLLVLGQQMYRPQVPGTRENFGTISIIFVPNCADLVSDSCGIADKLLPIED